MGKELPSWHCPNSSHDSKRAAPGKICLFWSYPVRKVLRGHWTADSAFCNMASMHQIAGSNNYSILFLAPLEPKSTSNYFLDKALGAVFYPDGQK
jgi:hypothetical protein